MCKVGRVLSRVSTDVMSKSRVVRALDSGRGGGALFRQFYPMLCFLTPRTDDDPRYAYYNPGIYVTSPLCLM